MTCYRPPPCTIMRTTHASACPCHLDSWGTEWDADMGGVATQALRPQVPVLRPVEKLMGGSRGTATHYNSAGEQIAFSARSGSSAARPPSQDTSVGQAAPDSAAQDRSAPSLMDVAAAAQAASVEPSALVPRPESADGSSASVFRGVSWDKKTNNWKAEIDHGKTSISLGMFEEEKMAAMAYDYAARIIVRPDAPIDFRTIAL